MNVFYFFYLIILFLPGETIFQLSFLKKKEKIPQFSIIEHLIYIIIIGLSVSSILCLILAIFRVLNLYFLILINFGIFMINFLLNPNLKNNELLIFRIINYFKSKESISIVNFVKKHYLSIITSIIFFIIFLEALIFFKYISIPDVWYFTQWAIDIVKYNPNLFYSNESINWYLGDPLYIKFQNYYLVAFLLFDVNSWQFIIQFIIPIFILICLILVLVNLTVKQGNTRIYIPISLLFSSYFLLNWFFYALPSNVALIIGLLIIKATFNKNKRSYFLIFFLAFIMYLFHSITAILFAISYFFTLIILLIFNKEQRKNFINYVIKNRFLIVITFLGITIITILFLYIFSDQIFKIIIEQQQGNLINYDIRSAPPSIIDWIGSNVGIHFLIISILTILFIFPKIRDKRSKSQGFEEILNNKPNILLFFWLLLIEIIIICLFFPVWYLFTGIPYLFYRYFIFLDLACIILAPFSFRLIIRYIQKLKKNEKIIKQYLMIFKSSFIIFTVILIWIHSSIKYNLRIPYLYVSEKYLDTFYWLKDNTPRESIYIVSPYTNAIILYQFQHCIMDDRIFINESIGNMIFNDSLFSNGFDSSYDTFLEYIFVKEKPIDIRWAYVNTLPENYTDKKVDYMVLNDYNNFNLTSLLLQDANLFELIKSTPCIDELFGKNYTIYVFQTKNNYDKF